MTVELRPEGGVLCSAFVRTCPDGPAWGSGFTLVGDMPDWEAATTGLNMLLKGADSAGAASTSAWESFS